MHAAEYGAQDAPPTAPMLLVRVVRHARRRRAVALSVATTQRGRAATGRGFGRTSPRASDPHRHRRRPPCLRATPQTAANKGCEASNCFGISRFAAAQSPLAHLASGIPCIVTSKHAGYVHALANPAGVKRHAPFVSRLSSPSSSSLSCSPKENWMGSESGTCQKAIGPGHRTQRHTRGTRATQISNLQTNSGKIGVKASTIGFADGGTFIHYAAVFPWANGERAQGAA